MSGIGKTFESISIGAGSLASWWTRQMEGGANLLEVRLCGRVCEDVSSSGLWQRFFPAPPLSMREILSSISFAADAPEIRAMVIMIGSHDLGWGRAMELTESIRRFRAAGKYAIAFLEEPENVDTLIAAACDRAVCPPGTPIFLTGLISEVMYFKGVLDKLDVQPELFQAGKYKSAVEPYTREGMSKEHREAVEVMLDSVYGGWTAALAEGRSLGEDRVTEIIDGGPWLAEEAVELGLIDELLYEDEVEGYIEKWLGFTPRAIPVDRFNRVFGPNPAMFDPWRKQRAIALITAAGTIHGGESRHFGPGDSSVGADTLREAIDWARENDNVCAVVLRINSPGGSATHSDLIWREVDRLRREKPVVVSMGDVAASGGYYIAMPADHIMASPAALTGSIGVIGGKINLKGLYEKIGIKKESVKRGKHSDMATDYGKLSPELRKKLRNEMDAIYKVFVDKAAMARKKDFKEMDEAAQGRVWTGEQARDIGLIDEIGNLIAAINRAKERAGISAQTRVPVFLLPKARKFTLPILPFGIPFPGGQAASSMLMNYEAIANQRLLMMMPYHIKIR